MIKINFKKKFEEFCKSKKYERNEKQIEIVGEKLRKMMPWISSNKLVNKKNN